MESGARKRAAVVRRPFTQEEDVKLVEIMNSGRHRSWESIAREMGSRTARQVRERWSNYLSPSIRTDPWTEDEDQLLIDKINEVGRLWCSFSHFFNGRSENDIKNRWYSHLRFRTIEDSHGKLVFVKDPAQSPFPDRKKRKRVKVLPVQNVIRFMEERQAQQAQFVENQGNAAEQPPLQAPLPAPQVPQVPQAVAVVAAPRAVTKHHRCKMQDADFCSMSLNESWDHLLENLTVEKYAIDVVDEEVELDFY